MHPTISIGFHASGQSEATITIGRTPVIGFPSEELLESCPDPFKCFSCLEKKPRSSLGGRTGGEWLCKACFPYVDLQTVDGFRKFDSRLVTHLAKAGKSSHKPSVTKEDWRNIDGEFFNAFTGDPIKLSDKQTQSIEDFRKTYRNWLIAKRKGFPGFPPPVDEKLR